jgi:pilus assembly protein Flp/PilA
MEEIYMMQYINKLIAKLKKSEKGQGMVEYALIIAFVAAIAIFVLNGRLGKAINGAFDQASNAVSQATSQAGSGLE